jgi:hypothetical protein
MLQRSGWRPDRAGHGHACLFRSPTARPATPGFSAGPAQGRAHRRARPLQSREPNRSGRDKHPAACPQAQDPGTPLISLPHSDHVTGRGRTAGGRRGSCRYPPCPSAVGRAGRVRSRSIFRTGPSSDAQEGTTSQRDWSPYVRPFRTECSAAPSRARQEA